MNTTSQIPLSTSTYSFTEDTFMTQLFQQTSEEISLLLFEQITKEE